jgi:hypothetical protein
LADFCRHKRAGSNQPAKHISPKQRTSQTRASPGVGWPHHRQVLDFRGSAHAACRRKFSRSRFTFRIVMWSTATSVISSPGSSTAASPRGQSQKFLFHNNSGGQPLARASASIASSFALALGLAPRLKAKR